uniref:C2H2-type domain-containing protein n=1 Tax=Felis catus TaxID=9685 RepID=A0ABI7WDJ2_FELCA
MEGAMAVRVTAAHTAEARAEAGREAGEGGVAAAAAALAPGGFLGLPAPFSEEDEDDVHRCGRCQAEFTALEDFVQHKLQKVCQRAPQEALPAAPAAAALLGQEVVPAVAGPEEPITVAHIVVETAALTTDISHAPDIVGGGHIKEVIVAAEAEPGDSEMAEAPGSPSHQGPGLPGEGEQAQVKLLVNKDGRYVCALCHKTFKTGSILKAHMVTHSSRKDHECKLCGASFRTKGSLIRHHRRHTDERPYKCAKCGKSFRESGALTRHLKSLTPCTEKIRFSASKDVLVGKEDTPAGPRGSGASTVGTVTSSSVTGEPMETSPVIHLVTDAKGTVIHEVHVQMQELPLGMKALAPEPPGSEELPCSGEGGRENLLHQAMQNSGIVLERVTGEEGALEQAPPAAPSPQPLGDGPPELPLLEVEPVETQVASGPSAVPRTHPCPQCSETFPTAATLEAHKRGHAGPRPFTCVQCGKAFPKAYLLKKHQEVHVHERRFRCGDCGKLYKTIAHVRGHRRVHSDERPYPCPECGKCYKTKVGARAPTPDPRAPLSWARSLSRPCLLTTQPLPQPLRPGPEAEARPALTVRVHRTPSRCTSGRTWRRSRTFARSVAVASGRRAPWCGTCGTTRARSPSSATAVAGASPSTAPSTGTCAPKAAACWRWRSCWWPRRAPRPPPQSSLRTRTPCWLSSLPSWPTPRSTSLRLLRTTRRLAKPRRSLRGPRQRWTATS